MSFKVLVFISVFFGIGAAAIWILFLRPVPVQTALGSITRKTFKPAGTYWQYPVGISRGFQLATQIPIAEADVFELAVDGFQGPVFFSLNTVASKTFAVGQRVQIRYKVRTIPFVSKRLYILEMAPH